MKKIKLLFTLATFGFMIHTTAHAQILTELVKVAASDAGASDQFGYSVCVSGNWAIVGALYNDDAGSNSGSAYFFFYNGTTWIEQQKITATDAAGNDYFGKSVSISGNYAIVGAEGDDDLGSTSGSVYMYELIGGTWTQIQKINASDGAASDYFGKSVTMSGNYAIVGSYGNDIGGSNRGSIYVFELVGGVWTETQILTASDAQNDDYFGYAVFMRANKAIIGAWADDDGGSKSGSAYIYDLNGGTWSETQKLTASDAVASDYFGWSVSIDGDKAIVGAYLNDDAGTSSGSAYIFELNGGVWSETLKLTATDAVGNDRFGYSVAISGTIALVGTYYDSDIAIKTGSSYVYELSGGVWAQVQEVTASDAATLDSFGWAVSISDNGVPAISAPFNDDAGSSSGNVYFYGAIILPVELISFEATLINNSQVDLNWATAAELNNDYFTVERSTDTQNWESILTVEGAGNSNVILNYQDKDLNPLDHISYYRLKQTDFDGKYAYSQIETINNLTGELTIYPNPTSNFITIEGNVQDLGTIELFNMLGQDISSAIELIKTGNTQFKINLTNIPSGMYTLKTKNTVNKISKQ